ncbi:hypothetical protein [Metamycoplasma auris]|uniref:Uncharacterized protein n=1 Tax=Metamycoplasma auris TaxID=51363 RepID=A0A2W7G5I2_9BACT|nr:hypothetical protein [Metamycoplasma auris]PZW01527.1 hypothetical protein BCF89_10147 [Metamycoplasma auris]
MVDNKNIEKNETEIKKIKQKKTYFFLKDKTFIWTIISFAMVFFIIISFLNIKGLTTIHSFSFGLFFGMFSVAIFVFIILLAIKNIFKMKNTYSASVFHFSFLRLGILLFSLIILGTAIYYAKFKTETYTYKNALIAISEKWYEDFIKYKTTSLPNKWTPGLFFSFIYFLIAFPGGTAGFVLSFIIAIVILLLAFASFFISDNTFKKIFGSKHKKESKQTNINLNLDKQNIFEETKENIHIEKNPEVNEQNIPKIEEDDFVSKAINKDKQEKQDENPNKQNIQIIPDVPDFSTNEFDLLFIQENEKTELIPNEIESNVEQETKEDNVINSKPINENNIKNDEIDFFSDNKKTEEKFKNSKSTKFSIIDDKEDLF